MDQYIRNQLELAKELLETGIELGQPKNVLKSLNIYQNTKTLAENAEKSGNSEFKQNVVENMIRACSVMCLFDSPNAIKYLDEATKFDDDHPVILNNYGFVYHTQYGDWDKSISFYERCLLKDPKYLTAYLGIIDVYRTLRHHKIELEYCRKAVIECPDSPEIYNSLGLAILHNHQYKTLSSVTDCFRKALDLSPSPETKCKILVNLGHVHGIKGDYSEAINYYLQAIESDGKHHPAYQNILLNIHYFSDLDFNDIHFKNLMKKFDVVRNKGDTMGDVIKKLHVEVVKVVYGNRDSQNGSVTFAPKPDLINTKNRASRKINIGYLSADLVDHAVSYFANVLFSHYNKDCFDVFIYANNVYDPDAIAALQCTGYRCIQNASTADVVSQMKKDSLDILIDLSSHTSGNRLDIVAARPVRHILSYLGYPDDTGFPYVRRISDEYTERCNKTNLDNDPSAPLRLPRLFLCYKGKEIDSKKIKNYSGFKPNGLVTFGCFAKLQKINNHVISAWIEILSRVPNSRLLLKSRYFDDPVVAAKWKQKFNKLSGSKNVQNRVLLLKGTSTADQHMELFKLIDIHLDTFPYSGTTITTESLYMNIPVITLSLHARSVGHVQRVSGSILKSMGLEQECVAKTVNEYVEKAVKMIHLLPHMPSVRKRFLDSPISKPQDFMMHYEKALTSLFLADG